MTLGYSTSTMSSVHPGIGFHFTPTRDNVICVERATPEPTFVCLVPGFLQLSLLLNLNCNFFIYCTKGNSSPRMQRTSASKYTPRKARIVIVINPGESSRVARSENNNIDDVCMLVIRTFVKLVQRCISWFFFKTVYNLDLFKTSWKHALNCWVTQSHLFIL